MQTAVGRVSLTRKIPTPKKLPTTQLGEESPQEEGRSQGNKGWKWTNVVLCPWALVFFTLLSQVRRPGPWGKVQCKEWGKWKELIVQKGGDWMVGQWEKAEFRPLLAWEKPQSLKMSLIRPTIVAKKEERHFHCLIMATKLLKLAGYSSTLYYSENSKHDWSIHDENNPICIG